MRFELDESGIRVTMSRRNLLTLIAKLDGHPPESLCTIGGGDAFIPYFVTAEEDDVHYAHPSRNGIPPGLMIKETEDALGKSSFTDSEAETQ
jgi:hypothetical protein